MLIVIQKPPGRALPPRASGNLTRPFSSASGADQYTVRGNDVVGLPPRMPGRAPLHGRHVGSPPAPRRPPRGARWTLHARFPTDPAARHAGVPVALGRPRARGADQAPAALAENRDADLATVSSPTSTSGTPAPRA